MRPVGASGAPGAGSSALAAGDHLLLAPGDLVPVRARLLDERAELSLDWINGESEPRAFARGDEVPAGAFHAGSRAVHVEALAAYTDSGLSQLLGQEPIDREDTHGRVRFWQRLNRSYAAGVLIAAAAGGLLWAWLEPARALPVAISVLVITCPCAMGIAVPLAFHLSLALLRRRGVFVRTRCLLDKVPLVRKVVFDKTGTVTFGGLRAVPVQQIPAAALPVLATMAASSNHPVSQAILQSLGSTPRPIWNPDIEQPVNFFGGWQEVPDAMAHYDNAFKIQWELFLKHVAVGAPFRWTLREGAKGVQLAEAGLKSWEQRKWVGIEAL